MAVTAVDPVEKGRTVEYEHCSPAVHNNPKQIILCVQDPSSEPHKKIWNSNVGKKTFSYIIYFLFETLKQMDDAACFSHLNSRILKTFSVTGDCVLSV